MRAECQVLRMRQACVMGRRYNADGGLRAGMQADEEEDQPALPPGWTRSWSYGYNRPLWVHQGPGEGGPRTTQLLKEVEEIALILVAVRMAWERFACDNYPTLMKATMGMLLSLIHI
eukprot:1452564-Alexandrium_andersonii.AAC.1